MGAAVHIAMILVGRLLIGIWYMLIDPILGLLAVLIGFTLPAPAPFRPLFPSTRAKSAPQPSEAVWSVCMDLWLLLEL